jgi:hypothetical protein
VLEMEVVTGVGRMLLSQEVSLPYRRPGAARAGQVTASKRTVNNFAMMLGRFQARLS